MNEQINPSDDNGEKRSLLTNPLSAYSFPPWLVYILGLIGLVYFLNPSAGILELLPDNLPILGNLDEGLAGILVWAGLMEFVEGRKRRAKKPAAQQDQ